MTDHHATPVPGFDAPFAWALGIEDTFVPQVAASSGRILDEYVLTQHDRLWREDLRMIADIGVRYLRYGIPWYQVNPAPGEWDWRWTDEVLPYLVEDLGIAPILDLVHYGAPLWLQGTFLAPDYPARVAEYADRVAERYGHLVRLWTPLNEPRVHAHFAGRVSAWPPYRRGDRGYAQVLVSLAEGIATTVDALRARRPNAVMVHVDAMSIVETSDPVHADGVADRLEHQFLALDLVEGRVRPDHRMWRWLRDNGVPEHKLDALAGSTRRLDVYGGNFYPQMSCWVIDGPADRPARRRRIGTGADLERALRVASDRLDRPIMLTETSVSGGVGLRDRWLDESVAAVARAREAGADVIGYTWFPAFSLVSWSYRRGRKPVEAYFAHMGLWDLGDDGSGTLIRTPTGLERRFADLVAAGADPVGGTEAIPADLEVA
jgi:beta-glucosidase/6-phospho-beta-glucosidase/beta-galactosidase